MIYATPKLDSIEIRVLQEVIETRERLKYALRTPKRWGGFLRRNIFAKAIRGSNRIEGYNVTAEDAIAAIEGEEPLDAEHETWAAIQGYRDAMTYVLSLADDPFFIFNENLTQEYALHDAEV